MILKHAACEYTGATKFSHRNLLAEGGNVVCEARQRTRACRHYKRHQVGAVAIGMNTLARKGAGPRVIVYRNDLLPVSETFIREQAAALRRWKPVFAGERLDPSGLSLDGFEVVLLGQHARRLPNALYRSCRFFNMTHPPSVRALRKVGANLVHVHFGTDAVDIWPQVRALGLPMIVTLHGYDINIDRSWWEAGHGGRRRSRYPQQLLQVSKEPNVRFIAVSESIRRRAIMIGIAENKVDVRYVGINTKTFWANPKPMADRPKRVLFVGRLVEKKGVEFLIKAFGSVIKNVPDAELVILGDGPLRTSLEQLANALCIPVKFFGRASSQEVHLELQRTRLLCLPSVTAENGDAEGFGMVLLEAQAAGVPVITSARGGADEAIIEGRTGFGLKEKDSTALASKITRVLLDDTLAQQMAGEAAAWAQSRFDIQSATAALENLYDVSAYGS